MKAHFLIKKQISCFFYAFMAALFMLFLGSSFSMTAHAADTGAVTVAPANNGVGVVSCTINGTPFTNYTYGASTDYITVSALPFNKEYHFLHWTDNGVIVSDKSTYSFSLGTKNHFIIAHFDQKSEYKGKRYHADKNDSSITPNVPTCGYASGYRIDGMALNTTLVTLDDASKSAVEALTGGDFIGAFRISFTFGYEGKSKESLDQKTRLVLQLFQKPSGICYVTALGDHAPIVLDDLDTQPETVTFETDKSGIYVITAASNALAVPAADAPVTLPASPVTSVPETPAVLPDIPALSLPAAQVTMPLSPAAPVTENEYQESIITILRYQLQQAGITPAA